MKTLQFYTTFRVVAVSSNTNSFGLRSVVLVTATGIAFEVYASQLNVPKQNEDLAIISTLKNENVSYDFTARGFEVPTKLPNCPQDVLKEIWKTV